MDLTGVEQLLSPGRLAPYVKVAGGDLAAGVELYQWNISISSALFEVLAHLEVGLRNAVDARLVALEGRDDWWCSPRLRFTASGQDMILKATAEVARRGATGNFGHVIAALPFGFWVGLFGAGGPLNYEMSLWRPALHRALPKYRGTRADLYVKLNTLRLLRNRIAHHEPIYRRHLAADHETILTVAGWISPVYSAWIVGQSRVPGLLATRPR